MATTKTTPTPPAATTEDLRRFIDAVVVPALLARFLREHQQREAA
jgi:hypothetical protein